MDELIVWALILFLLLAMQVKIGIALGLVGVVGLLLAGRPDLLGVLSTIAYNNVDSFVMTCLPLFILMACVIEHGGLGARFYSGMSPWFRRLPGGLTQSSLVGSAVFSATMGSSVSVAATMGMVAVPEMRQRGYHTSLIVGPLAAGGTLGILIPPSLAMIVYGAATEQSIGRLFVAGIVPGILLTVLYMITGTLIAVRHPNWVPKEESVTLKDKVLPTIRDVVPVIGIIAVVIGGIYTGFVTPTESAALGAFGTIVFTLVYRGLSWEVLRKSMLSTVGTTCMILLLIIGAQFMSYALQITGTPQQVTRAMTALSMPPMAVFALIAVFYAIMGCFFDGLSMMLITIPLFYPVILSLGLDPVWFAVEVVLLVELGLLTPPVGLNLFVIQGVAGSELGDVVRGTMPFWFAIILAVIIVAVFPVLATWLPSMMG